uniref:ELYS-bb domain-containing protein n=1 Tax=Caenorhabditis tropicalis TaxID=1561998 RepID=A0A1I7TEP4_9PELO
MSFFFFINIEKEDILWRRQLPYIVNFVNNTCQIFDIESERITHSFVFPYDSELIDVDYFPSKEGQLGILVGVQDSHQSWGSQHFVVALATEPNSPSMRITHTADVPSRITVVKTLFSSADMSEGNQEQSLKLYHKLMSWQHVVAIGCNDCQCHLAHLIPFESSSETSVKIQSNPRNLINLMSAFVDDSVLQYTLSDGSYREYSESDVFISALSLMPRSRTLLVGLSMGGILAASLNPSNQMMFLELRHERLIRKIAPLEPEDDPDKFEYFIAAVDSSPRHPIMIQLWRGSFKTFEKVDRNEIYDRPYFNVCLEHKILFGEKWISVNPIVNEREHLMTTRKRSTEESQMNISQTFGATSNRNSVILTYQRKKINGENTQGEPVYIVEGAIFDIDAWYYKRVPGRVSTDGTILKQCAFLSTIKTDIRSEGVKDIGILTLKATDSTRFTSLVSDADQLFYPSAISYDRVFVAKNNSIDWMKIQNLQDTIIDKCAAKLPFFIKNSELISNVIIAAGLVRKNILSGSPNSSAAVINYSELTTDQKVLLNLIVYYGKVEEFKKLSTCPEINETLKREIAEWAIHEAVDYKRTISDKMVSLFQGKSIDLSPLAEDSFTQGIKLFRVIYEYLKNCSRVLKNSRLHNLSHSVKCMRYHTKLTYQFILYGLIPVDQNRLQIMIDMHSKRKMEAIKNSSSLPIQSVVRNLERLAPKAQFWNDVPHNEWYPPTPLDLLESILNVSIPERFKRDLVVQYVIDWIRSSPEVPSYTERQFAIEVIKIMSNEMLDVDLEKIYYIMDEEKNALRVNQQSDEMKALGEKVFSMQNEELTYEKVWKDGVPMNVSISQKDMERFEKRIKMQMEESSSKLPLLDPETEILYQIFLYEKGLFKAMSSEAIETNRFLMELMPGLLRKKQTIYTSPKKTRKEKEIEDSVRTMFEIDRRRQEAENPLLFANFDSNSDSKRRMREDETSNTSICTFVPPTAKKIKQWKKSDYINQNSPIAIPNNSSITSQIISDDPGQHSEINMLIATPARYYKRPNDLETEFLSPSVDRAPRLPAQNSILKTAKDVQSANRGRIRFHESVPVGAEESIEIPKGLKLDFAILEDKEEEETMTTRKSRTVEVQEEVMEEEMEEEEQTENRNSDKVLAGEDENEECIEMEKSFENQDEFDVLDEETETNSGNNEEQEAEEKKEKEEIDEHEKDEKEEQFDAIGKKTFDEIIRSSEIQSEGDSEPIEDLEDDLKEAEHEEAVEKWENLKTSCEIQEDDDIPENLKESVKAARFVEGMDVQQTKVQQTNEVISENKNIELSFEVQEETDEDIEEDRPSRNTRSSSIQRTPVKVTRTRSSSVAKEETPASVRSTRRSSSRAKSPSVTKTPAKESGRISRSGSAAKKSVSRSSSVESEAKEINTPKRGRPRKSSSTTPSKDTRKREGVDEDETETPNKRRRGRPRLTSLKSIPEESNQPSTSSQHYETAVNETTLQRSVRHSSKRSTRNSSQDPN